MRRIRGLWSLWLLSWRSSATELHYIAEVGWHMHERFKDMEELEKGDFTDWIATECLEYSDMVPFARGFL